MKSGFWKVAFFIQSLLNREDGQDLVEYALCVALIGLSAFVGIKALAQGVLAFFTGVISTINSNFS